jgi:transcriptional regulator with XRE-family HTH domain
MRDIGIRLRHARKLRGMTQVKLAQSIGVKQASVSQVETGESRSLRGNTLVAIAKALRVNPEWLMHGKGTMERKDVPLSDEAVVLAQAWQRLAPELRDKIADMIFAMTDQTDKFGTPVEDEKVESAYGRPGKDSK